jgi:glycosyltransferase involved in cell wall biosynthesis
VVKPRAYGSIRVPEDRTGTGTWDIGRPSKHPHVTSYTSATTATPAAALPRISVLVPSYNSGAFLREALASVLDQDPRPYEVLVQDGGSADDTLDILRSFGERVAWVSAPDEGQSDALNRALARSTGDVVLWLNADDVLVPGAIAAAAAAFGSDRNLMFAYGDFDIIDSTGALVRTYRSSNYSWNRVFARGCYIFSGSLFIRRQALAEIGGFEASLSACMDLDLLLRLGATGRSMHVGRTIGQYRMHDETKSSTMGVIFLREALRVRLRHAGGSPRLWLIALGAAIWGALMRATYGLRYSRLWPRYGKGKTL